jgi:acetyl-CoA carboxylase biotin carboxyl carrier protein
MSQQLDFLTENEVRQISSLVDTLDRSDFDYFQIDVGDIKVTIGKGVIPLGTLPTAIAAAVAQPPESVAAPTAAVATPPALAPVQSPGPIAPAIAAPEAGWQPITATTMGRFYSKPDPNSAPYVKVGDQVTPDSTVGLIEVMKLFTSIQAGLSGTITQVCVEDACVVEFGQTLFYVRP